MERQRKIAAINAIAFSIFWLLILLAGADKPPPPGFLWLVITVVACAGVVYLRIPTYINWYREKRSARFWCVVLDGFSAGLVVALPFMLLGSGEPSVSPQATAYVIWFAVLGIVGALNSTTLYAINALIASGTHAKK